MAAADPAALSPTRTRATWKPGVSDEPLPFYGCAGCSAAFIGIDGGEGPRLSGGGRRPTIELPYGILPLSENYGGCAACGGFLERLPAASAADCADSIELSYDVVGGFDANALRVFWKVREAGCEPRWFALKAFTGMQLKYVLPGKRAPIVFALGDEDAYAYVEKIGLVAQSVHREAVTR